MRWTFDPEPLREKRKTLGLKPTTFGRRARSTMTGAQIRGIERGRSTVTVEILVDLCTRYQVSPASLFRLVEDEAPAAAAGGAK